MTDAFLNYIWACFDLSAHSQPLSFLFQFQINLNSLATLTEDSLRALKHEPAPLQQVFYFYFRTASATANLNQKAVYEPYIVFYK